MAVESFNKLLIFIAKAKGTPEQLQKSYLDEIHRQFPDLTGCNTPGPCIRSLYMKLATTLPKIKVLATNTHKAIKQLYKNINTISKIYTELNNHAKQVGGQTAYDFSLSIYRRTDEQSRDTRVHAQNVVNHKNRIQKQIELTDILRIISAYKTTEGQDTTSRSKRAISLLLGCGSRLIELLKVSTYEPVEDSPNMITVSDFAKKRGIEVGSLVKPLIGLSSSEFLDGVTYIGQQH